MLVATASAIGLAATLLAAASGIGSPPGAEPLRVRGLGLSLKVPDGSISAVRLREDGQPRLVLAESAETPAWSLAIDPFRGDPASAAIDQVIEYLGQLRSAGGEFSIVVNRPLRGAAFDSHLLLLEVPLAAPEGGDPAGRPAPATGISGYLVASRGEGQFVVVSMAITRTAFEAALPLLERHLATLSLDTPAEMGAWDRSLLEAGRRRLDAFTKDRLLEAADGETRWYRIHRPASAGSPEVEVGAIAVTAAPAPRGMLEGGRDPDSLRASERDPGVLVVVNMRLLPTDTADLPPGSPPAFRDLEQRAWVSLDRASEAWSLRQTDRVGRRSPSSAETGILIEASPAQPRPVLEVVTADRERLVREPERFTLSEDPYLTQAESILVGPLLREVAASGGEFAWLLYDRRVQGVTRRLEQVRPEPAGGFELRSLTHPDDPVPIRQRFDSAGRLLERVDPDGTVTTLVDLDGLRRRWSRNGLPLE